MSDRIEWGANEIARWCGQEMRADVDSNMHRRAAAILGVLKCHEELKHEIERQKKFIDICSRADGDNVMLKAQRDELLEALERLLAAIEFSGDDLYACEAAVVNKAVEAIAKAKGEA
jgi:hypothetical protein